MMWPLKKQRPGVVRLESWGGTTEHRVRVVGERKDGRLIVVWNDEPALGYQPGRRYYPPRSAVRMLLPLVDLAALLRGHRFHVTSEAELQVAIAEILEGAGVEFDREVDLGAAGRIDFMVDGTGIEVKVDGGLSPLTRQIHRYAQHERIGELLVVTTRLQLTRLPPSLNGKPIRAAHVGSL